MQETDYSVTYNDMTLAGTLTEPDTDQPSPLVICAHGTGAHDRNEGVLHVFDVIAKELANHGVATYCFDKRGAGKSPGDPLTLGYSDYYEDFQAIFDHFNLTRTESFTHIIALGHSEGTIMSAQLANNRPVDGIVLLTPFIEDMEKILTDQAQKGDLSIKEMKGFTGFLARLSTHLFGAPSVQQQELVTRVKASTTDTIRYRLQRIPAKHLRELLALNPLETYQQVNVPTLIIGGEKDAQCNPEDVQTIAQILGEQAEAHLIPDLTHLLRIDEGSGSFETYNDQLKKPIAPIVPQIITRWMTRFFA